VTSPEHIESEVARHARDYWRADGIPLLIGAGIYLLVAGVISFLVVLSERNISLPDNWFFEIVKVGIVFAMISWVFWAIPLMIWLMVNWEDVVEWFKVRLTYPRTGYVAPPSYWESDEEADEDEPAIPQSRLQRWLRFTSSFWFWFFALFSVNIVSPESGLTPKVRIVLLCTLLAVRALHFGLYPEPTQDPHRIATLKGLGRFLSSVFNSFIAWILIVGLLPSLPKALDQWVDLAGLIMLTAFITWAFTRKDSLWRGAAVCVCITLAAFLISTNGVVRFSVAILAPGLYAATIGAIRLVRHLRANPVPTV
jgi:hypothetical protein